MLVRFRFDSPGWFATDSRLVITTDGAPVYDGSFLSGFVRDLELSPGTHKVQGVIQAGFIKRKREWTLVVPMHSAPADRVLEVRISYSRMWGSLNKELVVSELALGEGLSAPALVAADELALTDEQRGPAHVPETPQEPDRAPIATFVMLGALIIAFVVELVAGVNEGGTFTPSVQTLVACGGLFPPSVVNGEWYRLISCTFLHANFLHLILNGVALVMAGVLLEAKLGWRWFLALYFAGAIGGSLLSLYTNDGHTVSVGASGAIMGLLTAALVATRTLPEADRLQMQFQLGRILVPSLLPLFPRDGQRIDFGAHIGGAVACALVGIPLYLALRDAESKRRGLEPLRNSALALVGSAAFLIASAGALVGVSAQGYPRVREEVRQLRELLPNDALPLPTDTPSDAQITEWLGRYPNDPRIHGYAADQAFTSEDWPKAEEHIRRGRAAIPVTQTLLGTEAGARLDDFFTRLQLDLDMRRQLIPNSELPTGTPEAIDAAWETRRPGWLTRFPNDPRVRSSAAWAAIARNNYEEGLEHAERGLANISRFEALFSGGGDFVQPLRLARVLALTRTGRAPEGAAMEREICGATDDPAILENARSNGLCSATAP